MQLRIRKQNMRQLFERMQRYQFEKVREQPDKALTEDTRALQDDDVQRSASWQLLARQSLVTTVVVYVRRVHFWPDFLCFVRME